LGHAVPTIDSKKTQDYTKIEIKEATDLLDIQEKS